MNFLECWEVIIQIALFAEKQLNVDFIGLHSVVIWKSILQAAKSFNSKHKRNTKINTQDGSQGNVESENFNKFLH